MSGEDELGPDDPIGLTDDQFHEVHDFIGTLEPALQKEIARIHEATVKELVSGSPKKMSARDKQTVRKVAYLMAEAPQWKGVPLKTLDLLLLMGAKNPG